jgi:AcrR family transcriptional regulator
MARPLRADARANRDALLRAARSLYMERGPDVPLEEIAQHAGVGRATVYRHFATRDDLQFALVAQTVEAIERLALELPEAPESFLKLFRQVVRLQAESISLFDLLRPHMDLPSSMAELRGRLEAAFRAPLSVAQRAGAVNAELTPQDVRLLTSMVSSAARTETDRRRAMRLSLRLMAP